MRRRVYTRTSNGTAVFPSDLIVNDVDSRTLAGATLLLFVHSGDRPSDDYLRVDRILLQRTNVTLVTSSVPFTKLTFTGSAPVATYEKVFSFEKNCVSLFDLYLQILRSVSFVYHSSEHGEHHQVIIIKASVVDDLGAFSDTVFVFMQIP